MSAAVLAAPHASAHSASTRAECQAQAKTIKAEQSKLKTLTAKRDEMLEEVEAAGETWEAAEVTRLFGDEEAAKADAAKQDYEALKAELRETEKTLQTRAADMNADVAAYNKQCATK